jgi:hypothetical protein
MRRAAAVTLLLLAASRAGAQDEAQWMWMTDARVFAGVNDQERKFTDISTVESQNWGMVEGMRHTDHTRLTLKGMASLEPFTMKKLGSPQVFQTGEAYHGAPLIDYQHPHDLIMGLGASYAVTSGNVRYTAEVDVVGEAALGPTAFMHRASARDNPQAPLSHHSLDSTHVTPGVVRVEASAGAFTLDASVFTGREPNENRLNIDRPRLDSWSGRVTWYPGAWKLQASAARIHQPEAFELFDLTRITASAEYDDALFGRPFAFTAAWGENREPQGPLDAFLLEWELDVIGRGSLYGRAEAAPRDILDLGSPPPAGFVELHRISHVDALTLGYVHDVARGRFGSIGIGGDATVYRLSENLRDSYGSPTSFHVFVRWHPASKMGAMRMN